ncbi:MAG: hypothetical protein LBG05_00930 [Treponema sp.]|nr:hypothetical protein [Treponema sp.]
MFIAYHYRVSLSRNPETHRHARNDAALYTKKPVAQSLHYGRVSGTSGVSDTLAVSDAFCVRRLRCQTPQAGLPPTLTPV